jgi:signal transduction histidine kinase
MHRRLTRILLVEDDELDAESVRRALEAGPLERGGAALDHVVTLQEGLDRLAKGDVDVVLLDLNLPDSSGVATILSLREHDGRVPLVVFTCAGDEDTAVAALEAGAQDYLVKDELGGPLLRRAIRYAIERRRITDETGRLQERLRQAEKRESLGALSAGVAFGFNNVLGTIFDRCGEALAKPDAPGLEVRLRTALLEIHQAAFRAAQMVTHLRDYAGADAGDSGHVELSGFVLEAATFLDALVPRGMRVGYDVSGEPLVVEIAPIELHRLLMGLVMNAAEAMAKQPGSVLISTGLVEADEPLLVETYGWWDPKPGTYAFLRVADTGCGIEEARKPRIFDPFHTTKAAGRGLGLAGILGVLQRHRAVVRIDSRRPSGTIFTVLFPRPVAHPAAR